MQTRFRLFPAIDEKYIFIALLFLDKDVLRRLYINFHPMEPFYELHFN